MGIDLTDYSLSKKQPLLQSDEEWKVSVLKKEIEFNMDHFSPSTMTKVVRPSSEDYVELKGEPTSHLITDESLENLNRLLLRAKKEHQNEVKGKMSLNLFAKSAKKQLFKELYALFPDDKLDVGELSEKSITLLSSMSKQFSLLSMQLYAQVRGANSPSARMLQDVSKILSVIAEVPKLTRPSL